MLIELQPGGPHVPLPLLPPRASQAAVPARRRVHRQGLTAILRAVTAGAFVRQQSQFRGRPEGGPERHHLYVALACPWSQRAAIVRAVLGPRGRLGISYADPYRDERGWAFTGGRFTDEVNGFDFLQRGLRRHRPRLRGPRQRPRAVGQGGRARSSPTSPPTSSAIFDEWAGGDLYPADKRARDRRAQRVDLQRVPERRLPRRLRALTGGLRRGVPRRLHRARPAREDAAGPPLPRRRRDHARPTGACCPRCCASTPSTTRTSAATARG